MWSGCSASFMKQKYKLNLHELQLHSAKQVSSWKVDIHLPMIQMVLFLLTQEKLGSRYLAKQYRLYLGCLHPVWVSLGLSPASIPNFIFAKQRRELRGEGTLQNERWKSCLDEQKWNQSLTHPHGGYFALWIFSKISLLYKLDSFKWWFRSGLYNFSHDHS